MLALNAIDALEGRAKSANAAIAVLPVNRRQESRGKSGQATTFQIPRERSPFRPHQPGGPR